MPTSSERWTRRLAAGATVVFIAALVAALTPQHHFAAPGLSAPRSSGTDVPPVSLPAVDAPPNTDPTAPASSPAELAAKLNVSPGADYVEVPDGLDKTGPIDPAQMAAGASNPDVAQTLNSQTHFQGGYKKAWVQKGTRYVAFAYIYEFANHTGAADYSRTAILGVRVAGGTDSPVASAPPGSYGYKLVVHQASGASEYQSRLLFVVDRRMYIIGIATNAPGVADDQLTGWVSAVAHAAQPQLS